MKKIAILLFVLTIGFWSCQNTNTIESADLILTNGNIYTVNPEQERVEALAVREGRIIALGDSKTMEDTYADNSTEVIDLEGQFLMPGFIEGHGHFSGLGSSLMNLNFLKSESWASIVEEVKAAVEEAAPGEWITGRGWHQEKWTEALEKSVLGYPYHYHLSEVSPENPVVLRHASGHGLIANAKAMEIAGVTAETPNPSGGEIVRDSRGEAIGVFEERAMSLIGKAYQDYLATLSQDDLDARWYEAIEMAQKECLKKGITSFQDAGSSFEEIERYTKLAEEGKFDLRLWAMLRRPYDELQGKLSGFPILNAGNHFFTSRAIKSELDGALGAFGAWLLSSYDDKTNFEGQNTTKVETVDKISKLAIENNMQLCVHAIGDRANRETLNVFEAAFKANPDKKDLRWRIEHAQHLDTTDIPRFKELGVIASMQAVHCTSDSPFVITRLGEERARHGAYPWRSLLDAGAVVTNGTDAPVEDVDAIASYYASVTRKRPGSDQAFFPEQAMTRAEAIYSYTMANAYAAFEENDKGSLEIGKMADFVVLDQDLLTCPEEKILDTKVLMTIVDGKVKYQMDKG